MRVDFASSWDTNDGDPEEEEREPTCNKKRLIITGLIILFLLSLGMLIAGSVMLGIGVHKSNESPAPQTCPAVVPSPYYVTLLSTEITYGQVLDDYKTAVATVTQQIRASLTSSSNGKMMQLDDSNTNPLITILGMSQGDGNSGVMSVAGIIYTSQDAPTVDTVTKNLNNGQNLTLYNIEESQSSNSTSSQMCSIVSVFYNNPDASTSPSPHPFTSKTTPTTKAHTATVTPQKCTCPQVTCPTQPARTTPTTITTPTTPTIKTQPTTPTTKPTASTHGQDVTSTTPHAGSTSTIPVTEVKPTNQTATNPTPSETAPHITTTQSAQTSSSGHSESPITSSTDNTATKAPVSTTLALRTTSATHPGSTSTTATIRHTVPTSSGLPLTTSPTPQHTTEGAPSSTGLHSRSTHGTAPHTQSAPTASTSHSGPSTSANTTTVTSVASSSTGTPSSAHPALSTTVPVSPSATVTSTHITAPHLTTTQAAQTTSVTHQSPGASTLTPTATQGVPTSNGSPLTTSTTSHHTTQGAPSTEGSPSTAHPALSTTIVPIGSSTQVTSSHVTAPHMTTTQDAHTTSASHPGSSTPTTGILLTTTNVPYPSSTSTHWTTATQKSSSTNTFGPGKSSTQVTVTPTLASTATATSSTSSSPGATTVSQTTGKSTVTPTVPVTTPSTTTVLPSCVPVTTRAPIDDNMKDIVVLIDDSIAVASSANYKKLTQWLVADLFASWPVNPSHWEVAPVQYAQYEYNILMDFDENDLSELTQTVTLSVYSGRNAPSVTKGLRSTVALTGRDNVPRTTILISASSNETDILNAQPYSNLLNSNGGQVITLAVGGADGELLAMLASGPGHYFSTPYFTPSQSIADQMTAIIKGPAVATTEPTTSQPSTPTPLPDLPCKPDVAIIFDRSWAVGSDDEFQNQINFIADNLTSSWNIQPSAMETELVVYSARSGGSLALGPYTYSSSAQFWFIVHSYSTYWDQSEPLISGALQYTSSVTQYRRNGRSVNTILFTYSSNYNDIVKAQQYTSNLGNIIVVSMGSSSANILSTLSGNVIHGLPYGDQMVQQINTMICNPTSPKPMPTTQQPTSTTVTSTTMQPTSHTTVTRKPCADCNPVISNIVVAVDAGNILSKAQFANELSFISGDLQTSWNHFERFGLIGFDDDKHTQVMASFGDIMSSDEFKTLVNAITQQGNTPSITSAMKQLLRNYSPNPVYGQMQSLIFTSSKNQTDINEAFNYSLQLRQLGSVIIVGMNMQDVSALTTLANYADVIAWPDVTNDNGIADTINQRLSSNATFTTGTPMAQSTTTNGGGATSTQPNTISTTPHTSGSTVASTVTQPGTTATGPTMSPTINCGRDLILLIDQSNAVPDQKSFDKLKTWITSSLVPLWPVSPDMVAVAPIGFANKTWSDVGGDFTENSVSEVNTLLNNNLFYLSSKGQGLAGVVQKTSQFGSPRPEAAVILVSAYDGLADVTAASAFADSMKESGRIIITLGIGSALTGNLKTLSSGPSYSFTSTFDFPDGNTLAQQISEQICNGSAPIIPTTTTQKHTTITRTTPVPTSFACLPDAAILLDNSAAQTRSEFSFLVQYVASTLVSDWQISPAQSESALIYANSVMGEVAENAWKYGSTKEFQDTIIAAMDEYFEGNSSIYALISYLNSNLPQIRQDRPLTAIVFTHTSDMTDISNSLTLLSSMPPLNLIVVGLGTKVDANNLKYLTGNSIVTNTLDQNLKQQIDSMICNPTTPSVLTTVTGATSTMGSTSVQPSSSTQTTTALPQTTVTLDKCYNCYPQEENILLIMDNSVQDANTYKQQQLALTQLISNWNHLERVSFGYYSSSLTQSISYMDLRSNEPPSVLQNVINSIGVTNKSANIQHALKQATSIQPIPEYGIQKTVFFTTTSDSSAINASLASSQFLQSLGSLTVVGVALPDSQGINQLASPGMSISWNNLNDTQDLVAQITNTLTLNVTTVTYPSTTTVPSTSGATQTTITSATNCDRDVILLVDQSNAVPDQASFDKLKSWLTTSLVPKWQVSPDQIAVAPYGFANYTWSDLGGGFEETSVAEVNLLIANNLYYLATKGQGLVRAVEKASQTPTPHGSPAVILISAYDALADVTSASQYSDSLKANGATVITLAVGPATTGNLKTLSSGSAFSFSSVDFSVSDAVALQISEAICSTVTRRPTTTTPTTTAKPTTPIPTSFPCLPDAAILLDSSGEQSPSEFSTLVQYVASTVVSDWHISPAQSESAFIWANVAMGEVAENAWKYGSLLEFQNTVNATAGEYYGGRSSIYALISYLNSNLPTIRQDRPLTAIMFTYTSDMSDISKSLSLLSDMPSLNLIVVGLGGKINANNLKYLSGNSIVTNALDQNLKQQIDLMICNPTTPAVQTTSTKASTTLGSTSTPSTTAYLTSTTQPVTTVTLDKCANCFPEEENILLIMDNSAQQDANTYQQQQTMINQLISTWNHVERISFGYYSNGLTQVFNYMDLLPNEPVSVLQTIINGTQKSSQASNMAHALYQATSIVPLPEYGIQRSLFFTTTSDQASIQKSLNSSQFLQSLGSLTVVGVALPDPQGINQLASPGMAISWNNLNDTQTVIGQIMGTLSSNQSTVSPATVPSTPSGAPSTLTTQSGSTVTPVISCDRDVMLLIDESNAVPDQNSFNRMITWITQNLTPKWPVSPEQIAVAPFGFANSTWTNAGGDFEEHSVAEVNLLIKNNLLYKATVSQGLTRALDKASQTQTPHGSPAVILISAYDGLSDVTAAGQYSDSLITNGATVITLAVGPATTGNLGKLSSGDGFQFTSPTFSPSDAVALQITDAICTSVTRRPTTTRPVVTTTVQQTTVLPTSFPCLPDTAILLDNSGDLGLQTQDQFKDLVHYVANSLVSDWSVSPVQSEAALIVGNARLAEMIEGGWEYPSLQALQNSINGADGEYYGGISSIYSLLSYYKSSRPPARDGHPANAILFTYSSDLNDISKSITLLNQMDSVNLIIVGLGGQANAGLLQTLSGNTVIAQALDTQLKTKIDSMMCNPTTPAPPVTSVTSTAGPTTGGPSSTPAITLPVSTATTTPFNCADCYPMEENILLIMDDSAGQDANTFKQQKLAMTQLVANWNHLERVSFGFYSDSYTNNVGYGNLQPSEQPALLQTIINSVQQSRKQADIAHALYQATAVTPLAAFGQQKTVFFTTTADPSAIQKAHNSSTQLQSLGSMMVVGVALPAGANIVPLASPGMAISWNNVSDTQGIVQQIIDGLTGGLTPPISTSAAPVTVPMSSVSTNQPTSSAPVCSRDVLLLLDESNAIPDANSFAKVKNFVVNTLLTTFNIGPIRVRPVGYANKYWIDMGGSYYSEYSDLQTIISNMYLEDVTFVPNITYGIQKASAALSSDAATTVILISASSDPADVATAATASSALKLNGNDVITLGVGFTQDKLQTVSSGAGFSFASPSFDIDASIAVAINSVLCAQAPTPTAGVLTTQQPIPSTSSAPVATSSPSVTTAWVQSTSTVVPASTSAAPVTTTQGIVTSTSGATTSVIQQSSTSPAAQTTTSHQCSKSVILLLDQSNAVDSQADFNKLSAWVTSTLLPQLLPVGQVTVLPVGYTINTFNDMMGGYFDGNLTDLTTVIGPSYTYMANQGPSITRVLQKIVPSIPVDSLTSIILISASSVDADVQTAVTAAAPLKTNGNQLLTMGIGFGADKLQSISSGSGFSFSSPDYNFASSLTQAIVNAVCPTTPTGSPSAPLSTTAALPSSSVQSTQGTTHAAQIQTTETQPGTPAATTAAQPGSSSLGPATSTVTQAGSSTVAQATSIVPETTLGASSAPPVTTTVQPTTLLTTQTTSGVPPTTASPCARNVILLMDQSNAIPDLISFSQLQAWITKSLLISMHLDVAQVLPIGYAADNYWNNFMPNSYSNNIADLKSNISVSYYYNANHGPSMTNGLTNAVAEVRSNVLTTVLLISASNDATDIQTATTATATLKQNGNDVITVGIGFGADQLQPISSGPGFSFASDTFIVKSTVTNAISQALCASAPVN